MMKLIEYCRSVRTSPVVRYDMMLRLIILGGICEIGRLLAKH